MNQTDVIVVLVCHNTDIINSILSDEKKNNFHILFVGDKPISDELSNHPRIIISRNLQNNIEKEKDLLTFTAWYAIVKNNLYMEYNYICILEYDVHLEDNFESELIKNCKLNTFDLISFIFVHYAFFVDVKINIMDYFLNKQNLYLKDYNSLGWFATTNHCLRRDILIKFVDWYYPDCLHVKRLDPNQISWYHERMFHCFIDGYSYKTYHLPLLSHTQSDSHNDMHNLDEIDSNLVNHYMNNSNCEFLQKLIDNYSLFLKLNIDFNKNCASYLCSAFQEYAYTYNTYEKQKMLFDTAKTSSNVLLICNYMGHIALIMLLANPNISITCIDTEDQQKYIHILEEHFQKKINFLSSSNQQETSSIISNLDNSFDFIHISQQIDCKEYLNTYIDNCINKTSLDKLKITLDNYDVYSNEIIEKIKNNNIHCEITNEYIANGSNVTKQIEVKINKKYLLIYNDETDKFITHITNLINSAKIHDKKLNIIVFNKKDINIEFVNENKYILDEEKGGGYWLWKPYIINETLKNIKDNDLLFYIDSKYYFTENITELYKPLLEEDILVWRNKPNESSYYLKNWCKMDIIYKYNIYDDVFKNNMEACWAGAMIMRKTNKVTNIIKEWLYMCCCNDITDLPSTIENSAEFNDHRHDQSLLSIVLSKYKIPLYTFERKYLQNVRQPW